MEKKAAIASTEKKATKAAINVGGMRAPRLPLQVNKSLAATPSMFANMPRARFCTLPTATLLTEMRRCGRWVVIVTGNGVAPRATFRVLCQHSGDATIVVRQQTGPGSIGLSWADGQDSPTISGSGGLPSGSYHVLMLAV